MGLRSSTVSGVIWLTARSAGRQLASSTAFFIIAAILTTAELGLASVALAIGFLTRPLVWRGLRDLVIRKVGQAERFDSSAFWLNMAVGLTIGLVVLGIGAGAIMLGEAQLGAMIAVCSAIPVFTAASAIHEGRIERGFGQKYLAFAQSAASALAAAIAVIAVLGGAGPWALVIQRVAEVGFVGAGAWLNARWIPQYGVGKRLALAQLRAAAPIITSGFTGGSLIHLTLIAVASLTGAAAAGVFRVAVQVFLLLVSVLGAPAVQMLLPALSKDRDAIRQHYPVALALISSLAAPAFLGCATLLPILFPLALGDTWRAAVAPGQALCFGVIAYLVSVTIEYALIARGRPKFALAMSALNLSTGLALAALGALFGVQGAAIGFVTRAVVLFPVAAAISQRVLGVYPADYFRGLSFGFAPALAMFIAVFLLVERLGELALNPMTTIVSAVSFGVAFYTVLVRFVCKALFPKLYAECVVFLPKLVKRLA